jgi:FkbM family methyltransferase
MGAELQRINIMWHRFKALTFFSKHELIRLVLGKLFKQLKDSKFDLLQEKESNLNFIGQRIKRYSFENDIIKFDHTVNANKFQIELRVIGSDIFVFNQVFIQEEYNYVLNFFNKTFSHYPQTIIDAGANIGLSTLYFKSLSSDAKIIALEPDSANLEIAKNNVSRNKLKFVSFIGGALWPTKRSLNIVTDFRDKRSWSLRVEESMKGAIEAFTPNELYEKFEGKVDLFKIDIEGAEKELFSDQADLKWLSATKAIAIEIHEEVSSKEGIINILQANGFNLNFHGELLVGFNSKMY